MPQLVLDQFCIVGHGLRFRAPEIYLAASIVPGRNIHLTVLSGVSILLIALPARRNAPVRLISINVGLSERCHQTIKEARHDRHHIELGAVMNGNEAVAGL
jgi:hypothetical protein